MAKEFIINGWQSWASLARIDKPAGVWLLYFPCLWGLGLGYWQNGGVEFFGYYAALFFVGAFFMRAAGCVYNDILDKDFDAKVARTKNRPVASGEIAVKQAALFGAALLIPAMAVWLLLPLAAKIWALASLILVALYPLMKRITYWPQLFLGLTFNWGIWVGYSVWGGGWSWDVLALYVAAVFWTLGYDTIYALQDIKDDVEAGVKSSAIAAKSRLKPFLISCFCVTLALVSVICLRQQIGLVGYGFLAAAGCLLLHSVMALRPDNPASALQQFRRNSLIGLLFALIWVWR